MLSKLSLMDEKLNFEPKEKILKVRSQNDYVFDLNEPLFNYTYVNECLKMNKSPEYLILDNPLLNKKDNQPVSVSSSPPITESYKISVVSNNFVRSNEKRNTNNTSATELGVGSKNDLENIATYSSSLNKINNDVIRPSIVLVKYVSKQKTEKGSLDDLINSIDKEIENNLKKEYQDITKNDQSFLNQYYDKLIIMKIMIIKI